MASTSSVEVLVEVLSESTLLVDMCEVVSAHEESDHKVSSEDTVSYHSAVSQREDIGARVCRDIM